MRACSLAVFPVSSVPLIVGFRQGQPGAIGQGVKGLRDSNQACQIRAVSGTAPKIRPDPLHKPGT